VRPVDPAHLAPLGVILADVTGSAPERDGQHSLTVTVEDDAVLPATLARLNAAGISVTEFSLHLPSLDEVFFTLTGSRTETDLDSDTEGAA
jgi:oleandomycin transport system ATP-binding protein